MAAERISEFGEQRRRRDQFAQRPKHNGHSAKGIARRLPRRRPYRPEYSYRGGTNILSVRDHIAADSLPCHYLRLLDMAPVTIVAHRAYYRHRDVLGYIFAANGRTCA